jgi:hypothetical protein
MTILNPFISRSAALLCVIGSLAGCIQVRAPDKPIEINLNVKVQQEVVVRLQQDAKDLIQNNPELFPQ